MTTIHSGDERLLWEGVSQNLTAKATGGKITRTYRLTTHFLYFESGGIANSKSEQIPLLAIQDVDVAQNLMQRTRNLGDVLVHIVRQQGGGFRETAKLEWVEDPKRIRDMINQAAHAVRAAAHQRQVAEQRDLNTHRYDMNPGTMPPPAMPGMAMPAAPQLAPAQAPSPAAQTEEDVYAALEKLGKLRDAGVLDPQEFAAKKAELLARI